MSVNLIELAGDFLNPDIIGKLASVVGEDPRSTQKALGAIVPTLTGVTCNYASSPTGASNLLGMLSPSKLNPSLLSDFSTMLAGGSSTESLLKIGGGLISTLLGANAGGVANLIANFAGIKSSSATTLLSLAAPVLLGLIGKQVSTQGLTSSSLSSLLSSNSEMVQRLAPPGLASALGLGSISNLCAPPTRTAAYATPVAPVVKKRTNWLPWLLGLLGLLGAFLGFRACQTPDVKSSLASLALPCGVTLNVEDASFAYNLATFMMKGSDTDLPKNFVFDNLNFDTATTRLTPESNATVSNLVSIMKCFPNMTVNLEGHTDSTGEPAANKQLSLDRANAIKGMLVAGGVDSSRIATGGWGQERPIASNDTEDGRAKNRRTELTVTKR